MCVKVNTLRAILPRAPPPFEFVYLESVDIFQGSKESRKPVKG